MATDTFKHLTSRRKKGEIIYREMTGIKQELAIMEKGDFFGEIAVLEGLPRSASAEALDEVELIEINSTTFDKMIRANIEIAVRMLRKLSNRLQEATRKLESLSHAAEASRAEAI